MAVVQSSAPRHILYYVLAALLGSALACAEPEPEERVSAPRPAEKAEPRVPVATPPAAPPPAAESAPPAPSHEREQGATDDASAFHLDDPEVEYEVPRRPSRSRKGRPIEIVLRSSPPGAVAAVDGVSIGVTPSIWEGVADATAREFTFVLPGYAIARYRFVPTRSGIVHGTLEPIKTEEDEAARRKAGDPGHRTDVRPSGR
jgi:hypothetical protein